MRGVAVSVGVSVESLRTSQLGGGNRKDGIDAANVLRSLQVTIQIGWKQTANSAVLG